MNRRFLLKSIKEGFFSLFFFYSGESEIMMYRPRGGKILLGSGAEVNYGRGLEITRNLEGIYAICNH